MQTPLFSITIPTYNRGDLLTYAIQSILKQTLPDFEIVVSDNHSTDDTERIVKGFTDSRIRYVKPPQHVVTVDSFEFARSNARGKLVIVLNDDDVLVSTALERFAHECQSHDADLIFSKNAEYRDQTFPGPDRNSLETTAFSDSSRTITVDEFVRPAFECRLVFNQHPSAFVFSRALAESITSRCGRLFQSNGVEYCAWPLTAMFAKRIQHIDAPLAICGRTGKSWGSNLVIGKAGKKRIKELIDIYYINQQFKHAPLKNFTMCNLRAEGILTAKQLFPNEFSQYQFDEQKYLRDTMAELNQRIANGVDMAKEMEELTQYLSKYPSLLERLTREERNLQLARQKTLGRRVRAAIGDLGARQLRDQMKARQEQERQRSQDALKVKQGNVRAGFHVSGSDFGFSNILECADFLTSLMLETRLPESHTQPIAPTVG
jgi:glycosyltransferase involved in cell wall biosynthesis